MEDLLMECHKKVMDLSRRINHKLKEDLNQLGFAWNQYKVMVNIHPGESLTLSEISEKASKKNSNITPIIDLLEEKGIVRRRPDEKDRRVIRVELTEEGEKIREQVIEHHEEYIKGLYQPLSEQEIRDFLKIADIFLDKIK